MSAETPACDVICLACRRARHSHNAVTMACSFGRTGRAGYVNFCARQFWTEPTPERLAALDSLARLRRHLGRERARHARMWKEAATSAGKDWKDRLWYELNTWDLALGLVDEEIRRVKGRA